MVGVEAEPGTRKCCSEPECWSAIGAEGCLSVGFVGPRELGPYAEQMSFQSPRATRPLRLATLRMSVAVVGVAAGA